MNNGPLCPQPCSRVNSNIMPAATVTGTRMVELSKKLNRRNYMTENESGYDSKIIINRHASSQETWLATTRPNHSPAIGLHLLNSARNFA